MKKEIIVFRVLIAIASVLGLFSITTIVLYWTKFHHSLSSDQAVWGQFGDLFGGLLNPIFSFLAFIGLIYTIRIQIDSLTKTSEQLDLSKQELTLSREALDLTKDEVKIQNTKLTRQLFETSFFNLINFQHSIVDSTKLSTPEGYLSGRDGYRSILEIQVPKYFRALLEDGHIELRKNNMEYSEDEIRVFTQGLSSNSHFSNEDDRQVYTPLITGDIAGFRTQLVQKDVDYQLLIARRAFVNTSDQVKNRLLTEYVSTQSPQDKLEMYSKGFDKLYDEYGGHLIHYFRNVFNILAYVDGSALSEDEKKFFFDTFSSQVSQYEKVLIFYFLLGQFCTKKEFLLAEKFRLLTNEIRADVFSPIDFALLLTQRRESFQE